MTEIKRTLEHGVEGVRLATKADEDEIFALMVMQHAEQSLFTLSAEKVRAAIRTATERKGGMIGVIERNSRIVGVLFAQIGAASWFTDDYALVERTLFMHPDFRNSDDAKRLIEFGKWMSDWFTAKGTPMPFICSVASTSQTAAKVRLFARQLLCVGALFIYGRVPRPAMDKEIQDMQAKVKTDKKTLQPAVREVLRVTAKAEDGHVLRG